MDNNPRFPSTSWTLVSKVRCDDSALVADALAIIYQRYRYPLYCWLRRKNLDHPDAEDVLQDFFTRFIRRRSLEQAEPGKGRLRGFLVTSLGNHLRDWLDRNPSTRDPSAAKIPNFSSGTQANHFIDPPPRISPTSALGHYPSSMPPSTGWGSNNPRLSPAISWKEFRTHGSNHHGRNETQRISAICTALSAAPLRT